MAGPLNASSILNCAAKDLARRARDPFGLLMWLAIPLAIGLMLKLAFGSQTEGPRALLLLEAPGAGGLFDAGLAALGSGSELPLEIERVEDAAQAQARIEAGAASAFLALPEGFLASVLDSEPLELELLTNPAQRIRPGIVEESLGALVELVFYALALLGEPLEDLAAEFEDVATEGPNPLVLGELGGAIGDRIGGFEGLLFPPAMKVVDTSAAEAEAAAEGALGSIGELFFGSLLIMALVFMAAGLSEDLWVEHGQGTLRRALSLPGGGFALVAGKLIAYSTLLFAVALAGVLVGRFLFGLGLENLTLAAGWAALVGVAFTSLLFFVQTFAATQRTGALLANLVVMPLLMFGGCFFPFAAMPGWMVRIGQWTPTGWSLLRLQEILFDAHAGATIAIGAAALVALTLGVTGLTASRLRHGLGHAA